MIPAEMFGVTETDHVVGEDYGAHPGQGGTAVLLVGAVATASGTPRVAVGTENTWVWA